MTAVRTRLETGEDALGGRGALERAALLDLAPDGPPEMLGDLALAFETCAREAEEKNVPVQHHASHLIVHGLLHLAGLDHEISDEDAEAMEADAPTPKGGEVFSRKETLDLIQAYYQLGERPRRRLLDLAKSLHTGEAA
jgi:hypothetical protein